MSKIILLLGPPVGQEVRKGYGGGVGGYTRKMQLYLEHFISRNFKQVPCFQTVRGQSVRFGLIGRLVTDMYRFIAGIRSERVAGVHMLGQYRGAVPREFMLALTCRLFGIPYLYEIKAGVFISWYQSTHFFNRFMIRFVLKNAAVVLGQGKPYLEFIRTHFGINGIYFPNFIATNELQTFASRALDEAQLRILFIGYAFRDKGVFELVRACRELADRFTVRLTLVGKEHPDFKTWADGLAPQSRFQLIRKGRLPHPEVLKTYADHDIYCYPTAHQGEGHNNTINEAMMSGLVIVTTKMGFLESIIGTDRGYLMQTGSTAEIRQTIESILAEKEIARQKTANARKYLEAHFTDTAAFEKLETAYAKMIRL